MKKISLILIASTILNSINLSAQCETISIHDNFSIKLTFDSSSQINDPEFHNKAKQLLVNQISSFIDSSINISSSKKMGKNLRTKKTTTHNANVVSTGFLKDPKIDICNNIFTMYVNKSDYENDQREFFMTKLHTYSNSLLHLLTLGNIDDMKFLKEKVNEYQQKLNELSSLLPLVTLTFSDRKVLDRFVSNVNILSTKKTDIRLARINKRKNLANKFKKGLSKVANGIADLSESLNQ